MLSILKTSSEKLEEMLKGLYLPQKENTLDNIEYKYSAIKFFEKLLKNHSLNENNMIGKKKELEKLSNTNPKGKTWIEYIISLETFIKSDWNGAETLDYNITKLGGSGWGIFITPLEEKEKEPIDLRNKEFKTLYENGLLRLEKEERKDVIKKFLK